MAIHDSDNPTGLMVSCAAASQTAFGILFILLALLFECLTLLNAIVGALLLASGVALTARILWRKGRAAAESENTSNDP